ncbi:MAG: hypothetical protein E5W55_32415 [Mesorhizobium sp.]|nr:MAG: hypothetical protein E5W55_32415 [Mesorhizobium sp.]
MAGRKPVAPDHLSNPKAICPPQTRHGRRPEELPRPARLGSGSSQAGKRNPAKDTETAAGHPRPAPKSKAAGRKSGFRTCSGIDGTFEVPASQRCPLSGYAHY